MLKQKVGNRSLSINVDCSGDDLTALQGILAGEVTVYDLKGEGGVVDPVKAPAGFVLNKQAFIIGKKGVGGSANGRMSVYMNIPHIKEGVMMNEITPLIVGAFDADYELEAKAGYVKLKFDRDNVSATAGAGD